MTGGRVGSPITVGSVCSGYGGLDLALRLALGGVTEAWFCEVEGWAEDWWRLGGPSLVLAHRFPDVVNYGDMTNVDWAKVARPGIVTAGFPCQGSSTAGKQKGRADYRWLWPAVEKCVNELRPAELFAENVENLLRIDKGEAFGDVLADLHALGYAVRWAVVGACSVGLSHHRHRVFIRATRAAGSPPGGELVAEHVPALAGWYTPHGFRYDMTWPKAGTLAGGRVYADETVPCGAPRWSIKPLPSPAARDGDGRGEGDAKFWASRQAVRSNGLPLGAVARLLPKLGQGAEENGNNGFGVPAPVRLLPTPVAHDTGRSPQGHLAMRAALPGGARTSVTSLNVAAQLLPTPVAGRWARNATADRAADYDPRNHSGWTLADVSYAERFAEYAPAIMRQVQATGVEPPAPTELNANGNPRLAAEFAEWMMTLPAGWVSGMLGRTAALKAIGNGVAPMQGAYAYNLLRSRAEKNFPPAARVTGADDQ